MLMVAEPSAAFALPSSLNNFTVPPVALRAVKTPKTALPTSTTVILTLGACLKFLADQSIVVGTLVYVWFKEKVFSCALIL